MDALVEARRADEFLKKLPKNAKVDIGRFKGLGEMNAEELKRTTLDPKSRRAVQVRIDDDAHSMMEKLMGKDPAPRYDFIMERAREADAAALDV